MMHEIDTVGTLVRDIYGTDDAAFHDNIDEALSAVTECDIFGDIIGATAAARDDIIEMGHALSSDTEHLNDYEFAQMFAHVMISAAVAPTVNIMAAFGDHEMSRAEATQMAFAIALREAFNLGILDARAFDIIRSIVVLK